MFLLGFESALGSKPLQKLPEPFQEGWKTPCSQHRGIHSTVYMACSHVFSVPDEPTQRRPKRPPVTPARPKIPLWSIAGPPIAANSPELSLIVPIGLGRLPIAGSKSLQDHTLKLPCINPKRDPEPSLKGRALASVLNNSQHDHMNCKPASYQPQQELETPLTEP